VRERTREIEKQKEIIELAKAESDSLLLNILPDEIAEELKRFGKSYARKHEQVTVIFADIKGFTAIAEKLTPVKLVTQLDEVFGAFDNIIAKYGMEKIKTIGDAYMCACGLPQPVPDNAIKAVSAALDMQHFVADFGQANKIQDLPTFEVRIGIHTGPLVAGVVGSKKFAYDIWGDAVNLAAQMEQHGEAGKVNISAATYELVKGRFNCVDRGKIVTKSKGDVEMYFVESARKK
jgi:class 3 adenylate cyclase